MADGQQQQQQHPAEQEVVKHEADPSTVPSLEAPSLAAQTATAAATPTSSSLPAQSASNTLTSSSVPQPPADTQTPAQPTQAPASPTKRPSSPKPRNSKSGNGNGTPADREKEQKEKEKGFMASVKLFLLSCVGPSSAHPTELDVRDAGAAPAGAATTGTAPANTAKAPESAPKDDSATAAPADTTTTEAGDKLPAIVTTPPSPSSSAHTRASTVHGPDSLDAGVEVVTDPRTSVFIPSVPPSPIIPSGGTPVADGDEDVIVPPAAAHTELLPDDETAGVTSGAVVPPGATVSAVTQHSEDDESRKDKEDEDIEMQDDEDDYEDRLIANGGVGIPIGPDGVPRPLLPPLAPNHLGRKCLVLDLDETLVHSSFKPVPNPDYIVPVEIEHRWHNVYVLKRPGVDQFLKDMGEIYEIVVYTASLSLYADPVLDKLDIHHVVHHRLFRESCYLHRGASYVKDLSQLGRPIADVLILDNSPASYIFHPNNAVPVSSWFNDPHDRELEDMAPFLVDLVSVDDVRGVLDGAI